MCINTVQSQYVCVCVTGNFFFFFGGSIFNFLENFGGYFLNFRGLLFHFGGSFFRGVLFLTSGATFPLIIINNNLLIVLC